jgi:hypothetical protein
VTEMKKIRISPMDEYISFILVATLFLFTGCATSYKAKPLPLKTPAAYPNATEVAGALVGAKAFIDKKEAQEAFGFDVLGAGMLPVQVVFDNQGTHALRINAAQTFLEDREGNLWPLLSRDMAQERALKYAQTKEIFKEGAYGGFLGGAAGAVIGAAIGVVTGEDVVKSAGKGAAVGAAAGGTAGGVKGYTSDEARQTVISDLRSKDLEQKPIEPKGLAYGFLFFPGEAKSARTLRLQIQEEDTSEVYNCVLSL